MSCAAPVGTPKTVALDVTLARLSGLSISGESAHAHRRYLVRKADTVASLTVASITPTRSTCVQSSGAEIDFGHKGQDVHNRAGARASFPRRNRSENAVSQGGGSAGQKELFQLRASAGGWKSRHWSLVEAPKLPKARERHPSRPPPSSTNHAARTFQRAHLGCFPAGSSGAPAALTGGSPQPASGLSKP